MCIFSEITLTIKFLVSLISVSEYGKNMIHKVNLNFCLYIMLEIIRKQI